MGNYSVKQCNLGGIEWGILGSSGRVKIVCTQYTLNKFKNASFGK